CIIPPPPPSTLSPYTTLFRSALHDPARPQVRPGGACNTAQIDPVVIEEASVLDGEQCVHEGGWNFVERDRHAVFVMLRVNLGDEDRKSTRLNSSHVKSSYAVF